jgi:hypothetical protein
MKDVYIFYGLYNNNNNNNNDLQQTAIKSKQISTFGSMKGDNTQSINSVHFGEVHKLIPISRGLLVDCQD